MAAAHGFGTVTLRFPNSSNQRLHPVRSGERRVDVVDGYMADCRIAPNQRSLYVRELKDGLKLLQVQTVSG